MKRNLLIFLITSFLILTAIVKIYPSNAVDSIISQTVFGFKSDILHSVMVFISSLGNGFLRIISVGVLCAFFIAIKKYKEAVLIFLSTTGVTLISEMVKGLVHRSRPDNLQFDSFPSGHVLIFMGLYGLSLFLVYKNMGKGRLRKLLIVLLWVLLILIGISRIYLGAHWFSDVLGSYILGTIWLYLMAYFYHRLNNKTS